VAMKILERVAMPRTLNEAAGLVRNRIVWRVRERTQRIIRRVNASPVDIVFRSGRTVLQIVAPVVLGHVRTFDERIDRSAMILTKALPSVSCGIQFEQPLRCSL